MKESISLKQGINIPIFLVFGEALELLTREISTWVELKVVTLKTNFPYEVNSLRVVGIKILVEQEMKTFF